MNQPQLLAVIAEQLQELESWRRAAQPQTICHLLELSFVGKFRALCRSGFAGAA